jgi:hypothetical protein
VSYDDALRCSQVDVVRRRRAHCIQCALRYGGPFALPSFAPSLSSLMFMCTHNTLNTASFPCSGLIPTAATQQYKYARKTSTIYESSRIQKHSEGKHTLVSSCELQVT